MDASLLQFNAADPAEWRDRLVDGSAPKSEKIAAVTREFEAVLLRSYLSEALKPLTKDGTAFGANNQVYGYMVNDALANGLSSGDAFGFSHLMQAQLAGAAPSTHDNTHDTL